MAEQLTKAQLWEKIAIAYYKPQSRKNAEERRLVYTCGICDALNHFYLYNPRKPVKRMIRPMRAVVMRDVKEFIGRGNYHQFSYFCHPHIRKNDFLRGDYCMLQKYMEEYNG